MPELPATILERADDGGDGRTVEIRIMPWGQVADTPEGREAFERGAFAGTDPGRVTIESQRHGGTLVGRGVALEEREDAAYLAARISETPAGDELLTLIRDGVISDASVSYKPVKTARRKGVLNRQAVDLWRVAIVERGTYPGAGVLAIRSQSEDLNVTDETEITEANPPPDLSPLLERMEKLDDKIVQLQARAAVPPVADPEYVAHSLGELLRRTLDEPLLNRALADQLSSENPGLLPKAVINNMVGLINRGRRTINAFGGPGALPDKGMTVNWPRLTTALTGLIAAQSTDKAAVVSAKVSFGEGTSAIVTYAGGSDISKQLIRRSQPPYLEAYARAMTIAWSNVTNAAFSAAVYAGGTGTEPWVATGDTDASKFVAALVQASVEVEIATGQPAEFAVLAPDLFAKVAGILGSKSVNPTNAPGTANAAQLVINVSGLPVYNESALAASTGYASNSQAAQWLEDPVGAPAQIAVDDAEKIGENIAYWSLGAAPIYIPAGIVKFTVT